MNRIVSCLHGVLLAVACSLAHSENMRLSTTIPDCRMPAGSVLPQKYQQLARRDKQFAWMAKAGGADRRVSGEGWETIDGSGMRTWFDLFAADLNGDGLCDWYINAASPLSSGGDRDTLNTLYIGQPSGYRRVGASIPASEPDQLGFGRADQQQADYLFGEELAVIHDAASKTSYFVGALYSRNGQQSLQPGYRIMRWDADKTSLRILDKWAPDSPAAQVYAYFKTQGARLPVAKGTAPQDSLLRFDAEIEAAEMMQACGADRAQGAPADGGTFLSPHLLARCKRPARR
jgi:hypothetical protein